MKFSHFFIDRPIFASVISILIVIIGAVSYFNLPVSQYPPVAPPTIQVTANFPGASPETLANTVALPIEQQINGVENMLYMNSVATVDGQVTITVTFKLGTDINIAQVLVQNRVAIAEPRLPDTVRAEGVTTKKASPDVLLVVNLLSPKQTYNQLYLSNYVNIQIKDVLSRIEGVGDVTIFGVRDYSMRIWLDPDKMGALDLTASDVASALEEQNIQVAAGTIGQQPMNTPQAFQISVITQGRLSNPDEFSRIVIKTGDDGRIVHLSDIARIELGSKNYITNSYLNGETAVGIAIAQLPGSNALETSKAVRKAMQDLSQNFPPDVVYKILFDPTVFISESVNAVYHTIFEAAILVVIVVLAFLQSWRATLIPLIAIPVSLIGTFAAMAALGFSLNNLSLFGLVLAIGIVVDDAIVVVENVERHIAEGLSPRDASRKAMEEVGGAVVSIALVLAAVFVPTAFLSGITGQFYRQFALTIAVSTVISATISLTLSPALTTLLLQPHHGAKPDWFTRFLNKTLGWFFKGFNAVFSRSEHGYSRVVAGIVRHTGIALFLYLGLLGMTYLGFKVVPGGFIPAMDQGYLIIDGQLPEGSSLARSDTVARRVMDVATHTPGVAGAVSIVGFSGASRTRSPNSFVVFTPLAPFDEREKHANEDVASITAAMQKQLSAIQEARITAIPPPPIRGLGTGGGWKLQVQDRGTAGIAALSDASDALIAAARKEPGLRSVFTTFQNTSPQFYANIDRTKAKMLGVSLSDVFQTLQTNLGSSYVNDINLYGRTYQVTSQADAEFRDSPEDLRSFKVRSSSGSMVPLGSLVEMQRSTGPNRAERYNLFNSVPIQGDTTVGFSSGQALDTMERLAQEVLPQGMYLAWTDIAYQERLAGNTAVYIFPLCVLFVFLTLAAQYESWSLPLAIILIVPMCLLSAVAGIYFRGIDNNILTQIGFVVLVGLACKNAILIVEFARQQEEAGKTAIAAAVEACRLRLRPILMTSFAFILGVLPLVIAKGPGAESRQALGTCVFAGMIGVTFFGLLLTPVFYVAIRKLSGGKKKSDPGLPEAHPQPVHAEA